MAQVNSYAQRSQRSKRITSLIKLKIMMNMLILFYYMYKVYILCLYLQQISFKFRCNVHLSYDIAKQSQQNKENIEQQEDTKVDARVIFCHHTYETTKGKTLRSNHKSVWLHTCSVYELGHFSCLTTSPALPLHIFLHYILRYV